MSGRKATTSTTASPAAAPPPRKRQNEGARETVEAIAIAFVLAFVFKTFQAEAYVIPTGSMAPTLYGRHKEATCEMCDYRFTIGASQEINQETGLIERRAVYAECPNCRFTNNVLEAPVFNGDRILVNKQVSSYQRFDVVVFKNPEEPHVNYIKRLVGLPGETVRVRQGDIFARTGDDAPWQIQRKDDPWVQKDIQLLVYDDRFPPDSLIEASGGERWFPAVRQPESPPAPAAGTSDLSAGEPVWKDTDTGWTRDVQARTYSLDSTHESLQWLRYRHLVPGVAEWRELRNTGQLSEPLQPSLILDFCGFNAFALNQGGMYHEIDDRGWFWVGDLTINMTVEIQSTSPDSRLVLELVEGMRTWQCEIDPTTGTAALIMMDRLMEREDAAPRVLTTVETPIQGAGTYQLSFANVDDRLLLWVNNQLIPTGAATEFTFTAPAEATDHDLTPVGIAAKHLQVTVSDLVLQRDIYYRNETIDFSEDRGTTFDPMTSRESRHSLEVPVYELAELSKTVRSPRVYSRRYLELTAAQEQRLGDRSHFVLDDDEYLMFGDNSPASKDSRLFDYNTRPVSGRGGHRHAVQEQDLIGEALYIFWPHGIPFLNDGKGYSVLNHKEITRDGVVRTEYPMYRMPFYPNLSRMKKIR